MNRDLNRCLCASLILGMMVSFACGQGIFARPVKIEAKAKPAQNEPSNPSKPGVAAKVSPYEAVPDWLFPPIKIPETRLAKESNEDHKPKIEKTKSNVFFTFDSWEGADIWVGKGAYKCNPGASRELLPIGHAWYLLGKITTWEERIPAGSIPTDFHFAASKDGVWVNLVVRIYAGQSLTVKLR